MNKTLSLVSLALLLLAACTVSGGKDVPPVKSSAGAGVLVDATTQTISLDTSKVPLLTAACPAGQFVQRAADGSSWQCASAALPSDLAALGTTVTAQGQQITAHTQQLTAQGQQLAGLPNVAAANCPSGSLLHKKADGTWECQADSAYLGKTQQAADAAALGGVAAATLNAAVTAHGTQLAGLPSIAAASCPSSTLLHKKSDGTWECMADATYLGRLQQASDSAALGGVSASSISGALGANAAQLANLPNIAAASCANATLLHKKGDGTWECLSDSTYLGATAQAADSAALGGTPALIVTDQLANLPNVPATACASGSLLHKMSDGTWECLSDTSYLGAPVSCAPSTLVHKKADGSWECIVDTTYLAAGGTATNASALGGTAAATITGQLANLPNVPAASCPNGTLLHKKSTGAWECLVDTTYLGAAATATNSAALGGTTAATITGQLANLPNVPAASCPNGTLLHKNSSGSWECLVDTTFLGASATATNSSALGGTAAGTITGQLANLPNLSCAAGTLLHKNSSNVWECLVDTTFLGAGATATNSSALGGTAAATITGQLANLPNLSCAAGTLLHKNSSNVWECQADTSYLGSGNGAVGTANLAASAVTAGKIASGAVTGTHIASATITGANIAAATITGANIATGTITGTQIAAGAVTSSDIASATITGANIAGSTIGGANIDPTTSITAANFSYGSPKTARFILQAYGFVPEDNTTTWTGSALTANGFRSMTGGTLHMVAAVHFPDGATLTNLTARMYDALSTAHEAIYLRRFDGSGGSTITSVTTTDAETPGYVTRSQAISVAVDNTSNAAYFLVWEEVGTGLGGLLGLYSVEVDYTYTSP